jgi:uncharacterized damage-inducible protein DinB
MKSLSCLVLAALLVPAGASAQMGNQAPPQAIGLALGIQRGYAAVKQNMLEAAEKMPEANYMFQPTGEIRMFGQLFGHVANAQFNQCSQAKGEANPNQGVNNEEKHTKAEAFAALKASFDYCDPVIAALTDQSAMEMVQTGRNTTARGWVLANLVAHTNEMYGTTGVYMRLKGLVPPSTERMAAPPAR